MTSLWSRCGKWFHPIIRGYRAITSGPLFISLLINCCWRCTEGQRGRAVKLYSLTSLSGLAGEVLKGWHWDWASGWHLSSQRQICFWASGEAGGVTSQGKKVSCLTRSGNWDAPRTKRQAVTGAASDVRLFHRWLQECPVSQQSGPEMQYVWWIWSRPTLEIPFLWWISAGSPHSTCLWCCLHL